jgi:catechol 2,3-dioxygenase-like lactoylglutathione lyase family enzyme
VSEHIHLDHVNLVVGDMPASVAFYRLLGIEVVDSGDDWDQHHRSSVSSDAARIDFDSTTFAQVWDESWTPGATGLVMNFRVSGRESVDAIFERLTTAGHVAHQEPTDAFWGARFAIVEDPDGNAVGIMSESDPARRLPIDPPR